MYFLFAYTKGHMKKNITIVLGIVVLFAVLYAGQSLMKNRKEAGVSDMSTEVATKQFIGEVIRTYEGDHMLEYAIRIPETASTSIDMDGALIRITDEASPLAQVYISYEGGRGYTPLDYINNIISPHVSVINPTGTSTVGNYDWEVAESEGSEWHIARVAGGEWLVVVENKKSAHDTVQNILTSIEVK